MPPPLPRLPSLKFWLKFRDVLCISGNRQIEESKDSEDETEQDCHCEGYSRQSLNLFLNNKLTDSLLSLIGNLLLCFFSHRVDVEMLVVFC